MSGDRSIFNHVGLCVTDLARARQFYEEVLGFRYWWEIAPPDRVIAGLLQLEPPLDLKAVYLVRDGLVLELLAYREHRAEPWRRRSMAEPGLTHMSFTVDDVEAAMRAVEEHGGQAIRETHQGGGAMVRDPDGQLLELMPAGWQDKYLPPPEARGMTPDSTTTQPSVGEEKLGMDSPQVVEGSAATAHELARRLDLSRPELLDEPVLSEVYRLLRERAPVKRIEPTGRYAGDRSWWFISRYADVRTVFNDDDTFTSEDNVSGGIPGPIDTSPVAFEDIDPYVVASNSQKIPMALDPPQFSPYRRLLNPLFSPGQAKRTEWVTQRIADDLLDGLKNRDRSELHHELAKPLPALVICTLLGLPVKEWERWAIASPSTVSPRNAAPTDREVVMGRVVPSLDAQMTMLKLAEERRREPREDIITAVAHLTAEGGRLLNYYELGAVLSILLSGGVHTTTLAIESALAYIGRTPGMHERLAASPELVKPFCEEVLRMWPPLQAFFRKARKDVEIDGVQIAAGDGILLGMGSANRDPEEFVDPDEFVLERYPNRHLTFAVGIHRCLGSNLARQELLVTVSETLRQLPAFSVDERNTTMNLHLDPVAYEPDRRLTVTFDR